MRKEGRKAGKKEGREGKKECRNYQHITFNQ
jgi:hypothetical protein